MLFPSIRETYEAGMKRSNEEIRAGLEWLDEDNESPIERAEAEATLAFAAAEKGDLHQAHYCARLACLSEAEEYSDSPTWSPFLFAIEQAVSGPVASAWR